MAKLGIQAWNDATPFMTAASTLDRSAQHTQALALFAAGNYADAAILWQQLAEEGAIAAYWHFGLALLLQEQEAEAQMVWMTPLLEADEQQAERWTIELSQVLSDEANRQAIAENLDAAWLIRQHLRQLQAIDLPNLLVLLLLDLRRDPNAIDCELLDQITALLPEAENISPDFLLEVVRQLAALESSEASILACIEAIALQVPPQSIVEILLNQAKSVFLATRSPLAADLGKICVRLLPDDVDLLMAVIPMLQASDRREDLWLSIQLGERCLAELPTLVDRVFAAQTLLTSLMTASGQHQRAIEVYTLYKSLLSQIAQQGSDPDAAEKLGTLVRLLTCGLFCFYFEDQPRENRSIRNAIARIAQSQVSSFCDRTYVHLPRSQPQPQPQPQPKRLKIGYLSESLRQHSVGWLCRWLLKHHLEFDRVDVHLYSTRLSADSLQQAFKAEFGDRFHAPTGNVATIADQIHQDGIDILVELDSLTSFTDCGVIALKPAPVQLHWLGYDAAGLPTTDYFIADPYVLPDDAPEYYAERIWRMPHTYIAVDGFEVAVPSLRRDQLDIPSEAIVYFSSQIGLKRNPDNVRRQLQILQAVPNSYFLIKSIKADQVALEAFFLQMAEEMGVAGDRLRFLPRVSSEAVHRANLAIADVVLDTFPYTGATTTLETLWMGIPLVTQVGEQFAARNSYTMLKNVGVEAGIAWSAEAYVEWGIRLGTDAALRQQIRWQLQRSRHTSPLWNARQFTQDLEAAYEQMWQRSH